MTDKEKILAEIERLKEVQVSPISLCNDLVSFINSLPEESAAGLKEDTDIYNELAKFVGSFSKRDFDIAKHFYKLGHKDEPVCEDLEKASMEWLMPQLDKSYANYGRRRMELTHFNGNAMLDAIKFGAQWMASQGWVDVCERMPEETKQTSDTMQGHREWTESKLVLAWDSLYGPRVDATRNGKWFSEQRGRMTGQIVHGIVAWRPIPKYMESY